MIRKDTDKLISFKFFSLADFYQSVSEKIGSTAISKIRLEDLKQGLLSRFCGANYSQIIERQYSWPEGVKMLNSLTSVELPITKQCKKVWSDDDGDEMDMERFYNDMPFLQKRIKTLGTRSRGNNIQKILINLTEYAGVKAENMLWKTYTAVKLCDELESRGTRCEVIAFETAKNVDHLKRFDTIEIPIKQAHEPLNTSLLCAVLSPWFLRHWIFQLEYSCIENVCSGLGQPRQLTVADVPDLENCIVIDSGMALTKTDANNFLKGVKV